MITATKKQIIVDIADMAVSNNQNETLITYSLGSCIGLSIWDPVTKVGGLLHYMLPDSTIDPIKAVARPLMFADLAIPLLFKKAYSLGAEKKRLVVKVAGAAQILDAKGVFNIGKRNHLALRKIFWRNNVIINAEDVEGTEGRTMKLHIGTGIVTIKTKTGETEL